MSAEVWRRGRSVGGVVTAFRGCGTCVGGGGATWYRNELGDEAVVPAPIDPNLRGVMDRCEGTGLNAPGLEGCTIGGWRRWSSCASWRGEMGALSRDKFEKYCLEPEYGGSNGSSRLLKTSVWRWISDCMSMTL